MLDKILNLIKRIIPKKIFVFFQPAYHWLLAKTSAFIYGYPSDKMLVIGVTGTAGKSSTCYYAAQILEQAGFKVGMLTTALFKIKDKEWLNDKKMTMLGRFQTQKFLKKMVKQKCNLAIIETTSQGIGQFRHLGINYDILIFTNLYPEHIEAHGGFENYKKTKGKLFKYLKSLKHKNIKILKGKNAEETETQKKQRYIPKTIIVNLDDKYAKYFLQFKADKKIGFSNKKLPVTIYQLPVNQIIKNENLKINLLGDYNIYNVLAAVSLAKTLNVNKNKIINAVARLKSLPGHLEFIKNNLGITLIVDYAFEPKAVQKLYETIKNIPHKKIIHILGSTGGGRDKARRPILGRLAAKNADIAIITNEDPYDEDPLEIIRQIYAGAEKQCQIQNTKCQIFKILDRRQAIKKALDLASKDDLVLVTGKGAEQAICVKNGKKIPWDDRRVIREELKNY